MFFLPPPPLTFPQVTERRSNFIYNDCASYAIKGEKIYIQLVLEEFEAKDFNDWLRVALRAAENGHDTIVVEIMDHIWKAASQGASYANQLAEIALNANNYPVAAAKLFIHARNKATSEEEFLEIDRRIGQVIRDQLLIALTQPQIFSLLPSKLAPMLLLFPVDKRIDELENHRAIAASCNGNVNFAPIKGDAFLQSMAQAALDHPYIKEAGIVRQFMRETAEFRLAAKKKTPLDNENSFIRTLPSDIQKNIILCLADPLLHAPVKEGVGILWADLLLQHSEAHKQEVMADKEKLKAAAKRLEIAKMTAENESKGNVKNNNPLPTKSNMGTQIPGYVPQQSEVKDDQAQASQTHPTVNLTLGMPHPIWKLRSVKGDEVPNYVSEVVKKLNEQRLLTKKI